MNELVIGRLEFEPARINLDSISNVLDSLIKEQKTPQAKPSGYRIGYSYNRGRVNGYSLLDGRTNNAKFLVMRLKENLDERYEEIVFWASQITQMVNSRFIGFIFDLIGSPPPSILGRKHLATILAQEVALITGISYLYLFSNDSPRGHKKTALVGLFEKKQYRFLPQLNAKNILIVDDFVCTGRTALACIDVAGNNNLKFAFLGKS